MIIDGQMTCAELVEVVTDWMEGELDDDTRALVEEHLVVCGPCGVYVTQIRQAVDAMRRLDTETPAPEVRDELLRLFRAEHSS